MRRGIVAQVVMAGPVPDKPGHPRPTSGIIGVDARVKPGITEERGAHDNGSLWLWVPAFAGTTR